MEDFGLIPFPWGLNGIYGETSAFHSGDRRIIWCISAAENEKDDLNYVLNLLFEPLDGDELEA